MGSVLVIGGGAAGLAAAIAAAECGDTVTVAEKMDRVGKKILATGNGRCNLMNTGAPRYPGNAAFAADVLSCCGAEEQKAFWEHLGLRLRQEEAGRVYPVSSQASSVLDALRLQLTALHVRVVTGVSITALHRENDGWTALSADGQRFRAHEVKALGVDNREDAVSLQYKRGYFNDWRVLDKYKEGLFDKADFWLDTHIANDPRMIDRETFFKGIEETIKTPFRVVPFFDPAPWGGQWMKEVCGLNPEKENYGWCFDCVPEENSLYFEVNGVRFELPSVDLVLLKSRELLGEPVEARFGKDFPIRFDFLDTVGGGNLSVQVHPTTQFIRENFGMYYTQDESYYLLDAKEGASVYLGLKNGINKDDMIRDLREAQKGEIVFDTEKYVNKLPAKKHDHYLIPGGTVHCSGSEALVLEISSTPNLFTFKLWDWQRLGLDGKPRPINVERGKEVIDWKRNTEYVKEYLANHFTQIAEGEGWSEERTGLHPNEFIETRRHWFSKSVTHHTNNSVNVLNLVEGEEVVVESPTNAFKPFVVHYAETFIVPASVGEYTITPCGKSVGKECGTIKAYVRF